MKNDLKQQAFDWATGRDGKIPEGGWYAETRDIFQAKLDRMLKDMLEKGNFSEETAYITAALVGEIGNNSFDHNIGSWPDVMGVFFGYEIHDGSMTVALADRGRGVLKTLQSVKPELKEGTDALRVAFTERISGRAPEPRGNGLKFVKENVKSQKMHLTFHSGDAKANLNEMMDIEKSEVFFRGCVAILDIG